MQYPVPVPGSRQWDRRRRTSAEPNVHLLVMHPALPELPRSEAETSNRVVRPSSEPRRPPSAGNPAIDQAGERLEGNQRIECGPAAQGVVQIRCRIKCRKLSLRAMQPHIVEYHHLRQIEDVVSRRTAGGVQAAVRIEVSDLQALLGGGWRGLRLAGRVVHQEIGRRRVLIVARPDALAAPRHRTIDHSAARERAVAEYIDHDGLADTRGVFQTGADAVADVEVLAFAVSPIARMIVEAAHL